MKDDVDYVHSKGAETHLISASLRSGKVRCCLPIQAQDKFKQKNGGVSAGIIIGGYTLMQNPPGLGK
jgi:hypothetical protein